MEGDGSSCGVVRVRVKVRVRIRVRIRPQLGHALRGVQHGGGWLLLWCVGRAQRRLIH